jgi:hypothetical protein
MKNLSKYLIAAAIIVCCFETACNKQEDSLMLLSGDNNSINPRSLKNGAVFTVSPGGDLKDSKAIQKAFDDAVAAGPGSTVQLTKGTFCLDERIEVEGFVGYFKGAGKDKTLITTPLDVPVDFSLEYPDWESLIKFRHGNINVSDFTIKISNPHPCAGLAPDWGGEDALPSLIMLTGNSVKEGVLTDPVISFTLDNVRFIGKNNVDESGDHYNIDYCINICNDGYVLENWHDLNGSFKITNCEFKTLYCDISCTYNGICQVGGEKYHSGNKFEDSNQGVYFMDCNNSLYNISNNNFKKIHWDAVIVHQGAYGNPTSLSKFLIRNNYLEQEMTGAGILLLDVSISEGEGKKMDVKISDNEIFLIDDMDDAAIWSCWAKDVLVTNNKIWGNGYAGICTSKWGEWDAGDEMSGWIIKYNNVQELNAMVAPIWLKPTSHDNTVIGNSLNTTVLDEGTNNILINVNKKHWDHTPQEILDKTMKRHEMMNTVKGHRR